MVAFGNALHVAGPDADRLAQALAPLKSESGLRVQPSQATLEDVFIGLIDRAQDNFANGAGKRTHP